MFRDKLESIALQPFKQKITDRITKIQTKNGKTNIRQTKNKGLKSSSNGNKDEEAAVENISFHDYCDKNDNFPEYLQNYLNSELKGQQKSLDELLDQINPELYEVEEFQISHLEDVDTGYFAPDICNGPWYLSQKEFDKFKELLDDKKEEKEAEGCLNPCYFLLEEGSHQKINLQTAKIAGYIIEGENKYKVEQIKKLTPSL